jgi:rhodanese-related sulfurtransferase
MKRWMAILAVAIAIAAAAPALAQVPTVQEALFGYLTNVPADWNAISVSAVKAKLDAGERIFILDVREESEFANGRIQGAVNIPIRTLGKNLDKMPAKDTSIVLVCGSAIRAAYVTMALSILGWTNVKDMGFGMTEWVKQGFPVVK